MRRFWVLLKKELRELLTLQILLPFVVIIVMFAALGQTLSNVTADQDGPYPIIVVDKDAAPMSQIVIATLEQAGFEPSLSSDAPTPDTAPAVLREAEANILVEIPEGFSESLAARRPVKLIVWTSVSDFSFIGNQDVNAFAAALQTVNSAVAAQIGAEAAPDVPIELLQRPISAEEYVIVGGNSAKTPVAAVMGFVAGQTTFIPIVLFVVIIFAAQMIATTIATEKENKTLETLLSYPVSRASIVTSKMVAAGLVALLSAGAYMLGMRQYMSGVEEGLGGQATGVTQATDAAMRQLGLTFGPADYALLGLTLFAGILVALSIAIILGAFAENVKSVQSLLTPLMVLMLIPYFLTLFLDLSVLPDAVRIAVMAIPFTYPFITGPNLFLGNYGIVWFGIVYQFVWFAVFVTIAARVFSSDRILTMKLSWGKKKR